MQDAEQFPPPVPIVLTTNSDPEEARLESLEINKYLLAKSYFDCREYDRCAAVFLPSNIPRGPLSATSPNSKTATPTKNANGKSRESGHGAPGASIRLRNSLPRLSQKSLFLALYAKYMSGEKRKDEDSEMVLGPADGGMTANRELVGIGRAIEGWLTDQMNENKQDSSQGWLEYLYGIVLAKGKNEEDAKRWLIDSIHRYSFNWGAWLELSELVGSVEEVRYFFGQNHRVLRAETETATKHHDGASAERHDHLLLPLC